MAQGIPAAVVLVVACFAALPLAFAQVSRKILSDSDPALPVAPGAGVGCLSWDLEPSKRERGSESSTSPIGREEDPLIPYRNPRSALLLALVWSGSGRALVVRRRCSCVEQECSACALDPMWILAFLSPWATRFGMPAPA